MKCAVPGRGAEWGVSPAADTGLGEVILEVIRVEAINGREDPLRCWGMLRG